MDYIYATKIRAGINFIQNSIRWNCLILKRIFYNFAHKGLFLGFV
uniref:Uncharacterized protein n=1 Tax=Arundo donax TaxID=35708 RepID=A0A0A8XZ10_ARUDO